jgi:hypothetical protein
MFQMRTVGFVGILIAVSIALSATGYAQQRGAAPGPPPTPQAQAPFDLAGTWVPLVTEDWRNRMVTPPKGDYESVPISNAGRQAADAWDPAKDEAAGEQCKAYGAPSIMRLAGRFRIAWENPTTIKIDTEAGTQTRRLVFGNPPAAQPSLQGRSVASWESLGGGRGGQPRTGTLKVVTTNLRPGYLRKNGVPYGANTIVNEWWDMVALPDNTPLLVINTEVIDPQNLNQPFITSTHFKKLPDNATFTPEPCSAR